MPIKKTVHTTLFVLITGLLSVSSFAMPPHGSPPQEAIDVCAGKEKDAGVVIETPRGEQLAASCKIMNGQLIAVPNNHPAKEA